MRYSNTVKYILLYIINYDWAVHSVLYKYKCFYFKSISQFYYKKWTIDEVISSTYIYYPCKTVTSRKWVIWQGTLTFFLFSPKNTELGLFVLNNSGPPTTLQVGLGHHLSSHATPSPDIEWWPRQRTKFPSGSPPTCCRRPTRRCRRPTTCTPVLIGYY